MTDKTANARQGHVVWRRMIDRDRQQKRNRRFLQWFVAPAVIAVLAMGLLSGWAEALGVVILVALIGLLVGGWLLVTNLNERANAEIVLRDGALWLGKRSVPVQQVLSYSTYATSVTAYVEGGVGSSIAAGAAEFRLQSGESVKFLWPSMPPEQVNEVRVALDAVLPGKWLPTNV